MVETSTEVQLDTQPALDIPRNKNGRIRWMELKGDPDKLNQVLEFEGLRLLSSCDNLSESSLRRLSVPGSMGFLVRVRESYPGGIMALREKIESIVRDEKRENRAILKNQGVDEGILSELPQGNYGRVKWKILSEDQNRLQEVIESIACQLLGENATTVDWEKIKELPGFYRAVRVYYPGGTYGLKTRLGFDRVRKPNGYWEDVDIIKREAYEFCKQHEGLTHTLLIQTGNSALSNQISSKYPGGMTRLLSDLRDLGLFPDRESETPEQIDNKLQAMLEGLKNLR